MNEPLNTQFLALSTAKALAILSYGESVASYRYRTLAERTDDDDLRAIFQEMADSEQSHNELIQRCIKEHFPNADYVLTSEDKELATVGARLLDLTGPEWFTKAIKLLHESELRTGQFYQALHRQNPDHALTPLMKEMADECFEHAAELTALKKK